MIFYFNTDAKCQSVWLFHRETVRYILSFQEENKIVGIAAPCYVHISARFILRRSLGGVQNKPCAKDEYQ